METTAATATAQRRLQAGLDGRARARRCPPRGEAAAQPAFEVAEIVRTLDADDDVVMAAAAAAAAGCRDTSEREAAEKRFGEEPVRLARALSQLGDFGLPADWAPEQGLEAGAGRSAAQDAAGRDRRRASGRGAARRAAAENALRQVAGAALQQRKARGRNPRGVCAARQSPRRVAGEMGTGGPGISLPRAGRSTSTSRPR